jgi:hypothetical protein
VAPISTKKARIMNEIATTGRDVIPLRSIEELAEINLKEWSGLDAYVEKAQRKVLSKRVEIGWRLLEIRQRIEAGERPDIPNFWEYFDAKFERSRRDARRLMEIASADNPEVAYQLSLKKNREAVAQHRANVPTARTYGKSALEPEPAEPEEAPQLAPLSRAKPKGLPSYVPPELIAAAAADDDSAEPEIARVVQAFLQLNERQRLRCFIRIKQVYQTRERPPRA